ncbi:MAG TPA: dihydrolipoamide acetyltransferase family protein [Candidatus Tectomicrobia bacterium]|jgi:pyruvate dehydrogenase E2 component (dihydrolipoamide acetyltransferase)
MAIKFGMPSLGHTMEKGKVIEWLKQEGDVVAKGEPLLVVETDKVVTEVEAPADGVVLKILVGPEEERSIGTTLALLGAPHEALSESDLRQLLGDDTVGVTAAVASAAPATATPRPTAPVREVGERVKISPIARKLAEEFGIDPTTLQGTGPGGRISKEDVLRVAEAARAAPVAAPAFPAPTPAVTHTAAPAVPAAGRLSVARTIPLSGMRGRVAERMWQSWNTIPRVTEVMQIDMSATVAFRDAMLGQWEQQYGLRVSLNDMLVKAVVLALQRHPRLNATLLNQEVRLHNSVNMGVAVNLDEGLIVPIIFNAEQKDLGQLARESRDLAEKARAGRLQLDDISDGTFTMTNLGTTGIDLFTPIINPPQVAILGVGMVQRRPVVVGDALAIRPSVYLCLVFDHRAVDGVPAANFLQEVQRLLSKPQEYAL